MKISKLNSRGFAHHFVLALAVVGIISAFAFQQVAGNASSCANTVVGVGNAGPCVKLVQSKVGATVDGNFGPNTKRKVQDFQRSKGLVADGVVGPRTWAALLGSSAPKKSASVSAQDQKIKCTYVDGSARQRVVTTSRSRCSSLHSYAQTSYVSCKSKEGHALRPDNSQTNNMSLNECHSKGGTVRKTLVQGNTTSGVDGTPKIKCTYVNGAAQKRTISTTKTRCQSLQTQAANTVVRCKIKDVHAGRPDNSKTVNKTLNECWSLQGTVIT